MVARAPSAGGTSRSCVRPSAVMARRVPSACVGARTRATAGPAGARARPDAVGAVRSCAASPLVASGPASAGGARARSPAAPSRARPAPRWTPAAPACPTRAPARQASEDARRPARPPPCASSSNRGSPADRGQVRGPRNDAVPAAPWRPPGRRARLGHRHRPRSVRARPTRRRDHGDWPPGRSGARRCR
ncbi:MAG: hypothetical protein QOK16_834 [Solirubrobacteraceae bacterium]|nr:hypothetical protein [Solirubrobacteraceae bacterium]